MIKSMTGFGKGEVAGKLGRFTVEIRTVNHRYFDVSSRIPNSLSQLEDRIKKYLHRYIKRGKVNFSILHRKNGKNFDYIRLDEEAIKRYYRMLTKIKKRFKLRDDIKLSDLFSFSDVVIQEQPEHNVSEAWLLLEKSIKKAVLHCNRMREKEGRALYQDLSGRIGKISGYIAEISRLTPGLIAGYKKKLDLRIRDILKHRNFEIDKARLETELAIFARQCDVSEEITRARSHISSLKDALHSNKETGRKLDFILQELQREINTLGSKAGSAKISRLVVDIKSEIEKIREQVQNVE